MRNGDYLSNREGQEEVSAKSVRVKSEAVVNQCGGEPEVIADQSLFPECGPHEQLDEAMMLPSLS